MTPITVEQANQYAGEHLGAVFTRVLDQLADAVERGLVDQRPDLRLRVAGIADGERARPRREQFRERLRD